MYIVAELRVERKVDMPELQHGACLAEWLGQQLEVEMADMLEQQNLALLEERTVPLHEVAGVEGLVEWLHGAHWE